MGGIRWPFFIQPSYPPSRAVLLFRASRCGGLPSLLSGSVPAIIIFEPYAADRDWVSAIGVYFLSFLPLKTSKLHILTSALGAQHPNAG